MTSASQPTERSRLYSGLQNEHTYGFCRAMRIGDRVLVSGTTALLPEGGVSAELLGDTYGQVREVLRRVQETLAGFGLGLEHVVRTTVYFTQEDAIPDLIRAHGEVFGEIKPISSAVGVACLFHPDALVEIEVEAVE